MADVRTLVDTLYGGELDALLKEWRKSMSCEAIARRIENAKGVSLSGETIRRWTAPETETAS